MAMERIRRLGRRNMFSKNRSGDVLWLGEACICRHLNLNQVPRAREAIWHRVKDQLAKTIRETQGTGVESRTI
jgi:hypothetical protein